jgi:CDP-diacylglycerol--glycerol-3-phosphate 3-phosphatidyltransferase
MECWNIGIKTKALPNTPLLHHSIISLFPYSILSSFQHFIDIFDEHVMLMEYSRFDSDDSSPMIGNKIGHRLDPALNAIYRRIAGNRGDPNLLTLLGFLATIGASALIVADLWITAGFAIILSGVLDLFDGAVARNLDKVTPFGGFLDSVLDRYSDSFILLALIIFYLRKGNGQLVILTSFASIGTTLISYARARAEAARIECTVGLMERAERIILLSAGFLFNIMEPILWILAIFTHVTVVQRVYYVWKKSRTT